MFKKSIIVTSIVAVVMTVLGITLASPLAKVFVGYDKDLLAMASNGMGLYSLSFLVCGFNIFASSFFTALNNGLVSAIISFMRTLVIQTAAIFILPIFLGLNGIWLAIVVAEGVTLILTVVLIVANKKKYQYI